MSARAVDTTTAPSAIAMSVPALGKVFVFAAVTVLIAEAIGARTIPLGGAYSVVLLPLLWALLIAAGWGIARPYLPGPLKITNGMQAISAAVLQPALLIFCAKLGLLVGWSLPKILSSGWALAFQELGHFFGTMVFGLPIALLLGIKREAIGATFSVGREPSLAIIGEKFGMASPEGRGVLAEYMTGTLFGAVFISIFAGVLASLHILHPLALAMGAGVGSGGLMAAASGAIAAQEPPEIAKDVAAFAAASNLITTTVGTYFTLFLSLPFTIWAYGVLEPILGRFSRNRVEPETAGPVHAESQVAPFSALQLLCVWVVAGSIALIGNYLGYHTAVDGTVIAGLAIIIAAVIVGYALYRLTRGFVPAAIWVSFVAMALTYPGMPYAAEIAALTGKINFLALATPMLAFAGLSVAKDLPVFRRLGWRIVVVSLLANAGTFLGASIIAQVLMQA